MTDVDTEIDEDEAQKTPDEMLDWVCWRLATEGEQFYPPDETAEESVVSLGAEMEGFEGTTEYGHHVRAYTTAVEYFCYLRNMRFDPVGRAKRQIERNEALADRDDYDGSLDWTWLRESRYTSRFPEYFEE